MATDDPTEVAPGPEAQASAAPPVRYERLRLLGAGGGGEVFLARDHVLGREVALKVAAVDRRDGARRFVEEARRCGSLDHPNIVPVHDLGTDGDRPWFTMKVVSGRTFQEVLAERQGRPPDAAFLHTALGVVSKIADAVAFAHARGVVHCDLKPSNVMLGSFGEVFVLDWGIARTTGGEAHAAGVSGTPGYMSPEQCAGETPDERSDVHALGALLFEVLTGELPYGGATPQARFAATRAGRVRRPADVRPDWPLPEGLCAIATKAVSPAPSDRHPSVLAFQAALQDALRGGWWFEQQVFAAGERVVREGDPADRAFIVVDGRAEVLAGGVRVREVGPGEVFGELGLVADGVRTADVVASAPLTVMVVHRDALQSELGHGSWLSLLFRAMAARFREAHEALHPPRGPGPR